MRALHGTELAPPSSMFFSGSYSLSLPVVLSFFPLTHTLHNLPKSLVFRLAFSWSQKSTKMENKKVRWEFAWSWSDSAGKRQNVSLCAGRGGFLAACQLPAAALQHVNMSVARETRRAPTATQSTEKPYCYTLFSLECKMLNKIVLLSCAARSITKMYTEFTLNRPKMQTLQPAGVASSATTRIWSLTGFPPMTIYNRADCIVNQVWNVTTKDWFGVFAVVAQKVSAFNLNEIL